MNKIRAMARRMTVVASLCVMCAVFLVVQHETLAKWQLDTEENIKRVGIVVEMSNIKDISAIKTCVAHVVEGMPRDALVHVHMMVEDQSSIPRIRGMLGHFPFAELKVETWHGANKDDGFIGQILELASQQISFHTILRIGPSSDSDLYVRAVESLCGTASQVHSIFQVMEKEIDPTLIAPQSSIFGPQIKPSAFVGGNPKFDMTAAELHKIYCVLYACGPVWTVHDLHFVAGGSFWLNKAGMDMSSWAKQIKAVRQFLVKSNREMVPVQLLPSFVNARGGALMEIPPAPKPFAMYFPQYHKVPENDRFWGENFTEWTLLQNLTLDSPPLRKPVPYENGGLGYYNLENVHIRKRQEDMARRYGIQGFVYYHYWFSGELAPPGHVVMDKVLQLMLKDGAPNLPFMLSWANEPWTRRWNGAEAEALLTQSYGDEQEWSEHFEYLLPFFKHPQYVLIRGCPVFFVYRIGHLKAQASPMLELWHKLAVQNGFSGMHIVETLGGFQHVDGSTLDPHIKGGFHFWPAFCYNRWANHWREGAGGGQPDKFFMCTDQGAASFDDLQKWPFDEFPPGYIQYWGAFVGFDRRPRDASWHALIRSPAEFNASLHRSFDAMGRRRDRTIDINLFFITAWNEWNEQAVLEPDNIFNFAYLESLSWNLNRIAAIRVNDAST